MSKLLGELLFGLVRSIIVDRANGIAWRRTRLVLGLLLGAAAYAFFPIVVLLLGIKN